MVSYQLLVFGSALLIFGLIYGLVSDIFFDLFAAGTIGYIGTNDWFNFGQGWMDFIFTMVPSVLFVSGGVYLVARAMKG